MRRLQDCLDEERVLIGKDEFEEQIREEVAQAFKEEELKQAGEMFRKRVGHGISTAYCAFGLRKANRSWFTDSTGKSWLDLQKRQADRSKQCRNSISVISMPLLHINLLTSTPTHGSKYQH